MQQKTFNTQGKKISYRLYGEGAPVMLLHGFGEDSSVWHLQVNALKDHFRLIVPDIPGSGDSEWIPGADIDTYAAVMKELWDIEGTANPSLALIGHSMGGYIAMAFAEKYPQSLCSLGMFHSSAFADSTEKKETRRKAIAFIRQNGTEAFLKTAVPGLFTSWFKEQHPLQVEALIEAGKKFTADALVQYYEAMMARPDRTGVLKQIKVPVLFLVGEHDTAVPFNSSMQQCYLAAESHVYILRNSAHMGMWEETGKANEALKRFLSGQA